MGRKYRARIRIDHETTKRHILDPYKFLEDKYFESDQDAIDHFSKKLHDRSFEVLRDESPTEYVGAFILIYRSPRAIDLYKIDNQYKLI